MIIKINQSIISIQTSTTYAIFSFESCSIGECYLNLDNLAHKANVLLQKTLHTLFKYLYAFIGDYLDELSLPEFKMFLPCFTEKSTQIWNDMRIMTQFSFSGELSNQVRLQILLIRLYSLLKTPCKSYKRMNLLIFRLYI